MKCPNCGTNNRAETKFCRECGHSLLERVKGSSSGKKQALAADRNTEKRSKRRGFWWTIGGIAGLLLACSICGLLYWSMLIPIPLLPVATPGSEILRRARILQENLARPAAWEENVHAAEVEGEPQTFNFENGKLQLPEAYGPQVDLHVRTVSQVGIWEEMGVFGAGQLIYTMKNEGEPMAAGEYGYHAEWVVIDEVDNKVIENNQWYGCTGGDQEELTCTGPDWREYDTAQMCIYYEAPASQLPLECDAFAGEDTYPVSDEQACLEEDSTFTFDRIEEINEENAYWYFKTNDPNGFDYKYSLGLTTEAGERWGSWCKAIKDGLQCVGRNTIENPDFVWEISRSFEACIGKPLASGTIGGMTANPEEVVMPTQSCESSDAGGWKLEKNYTLYNTDRNWILLPPKGVEVWAGKYSIKITTVDGKSDTGQCVIPSEAMITSKGDICDRDTPCLESREELIPGSVLCWWDRSSGTLNPARDVWDKWEVIQEQTGTAENREDIDCQKPIMSRSNSYSPSVRCAPFIGMNFSLVYPSWNAGEPLTFYIKMPVGVPGLVSPVMGDNEPWLYSAKIGDYETSVCSDMGYKDRLYCEIDLPAEYSSTRQPFALSLNGCYSPVLTGEADLPSRIDKGFRRKDQTEGEGEGGSSCTPGVSYYCDGIGPPICHCPG